MTYLLRNNVVFFFQKDNKVPMIIPQDCVKPMMSITDQRLRENFGVGSMFIFASNSIMGTIKTKLESQIIG